MLYESDSDEEELLLLLALCEEKQRKSTRKRKWIQETNLRRERDGEFHKLCRELESSEDKYFNYFHMSKGSFEELHKLVQPSIMKTDTNWRNSISSKERLAICLRTAYNRTMEKQRDEPEDVTNEPLSSMSEPMKVQDAVASTLATPFAQPIIAASKSKTQKQREYRQRIAASRTPAQAAAARKSKNERQRKNRLRQAANLAIASGFLEATTTFSSRAGEESNNVQTRSQRQHAQQQSTTTADQPDERVNLTNEPHFPAIPVPMEVREAVASTSATPFAKPITAAPKTRAQIQREYRQRIAASKTPAQAAAAREARNVRDRNNRLRHAANLAIASGSLEVTATSSSRSGQRLNTVHIDTQRQFTDQQRQTLATEPAENTVQPSTSSDQIEVQAQSTWNTKWA